MIEQLRYAAALFLHLFKRTSKQIKLKRMIGVENSCESLMTKINELIVSMDDVLQVFQSKYDESQELVAYDGFAEGSQKVEAVVCNEKIN